jgi:hypothetical protein
MRLGDVFMIQDNQLRGFYALWGLDRNRENEESVIPPGKYYIAEKRGNYYVVGRIFNEYGFEVFGQKDSYFVHEDYLKVVQPISKVRDEDILINKTVENMIEKGRLI